MKARFIMGLVAALAIQTGIVAVMVYSRVSVLETGREITVRSTFVDPRDIFRGHYVRLNLSLTVDADQIPKELDRKTPFYVSLHEGEDGFWVVKAVYDHFPETADPVLLGKRFSRRNSGRRSRIFLPFDRYFADYDRAQELENLRRDQKLGVILALDGKGGGVIKGLTVDGEKVYDEPIW